MGQAKHRGSLAQRVAAATAHIDALRPAHIVCNQCRNEIAEVVDIDVRKMHGLTAAFAATCRECQSVTYAMSGDPQTVQALLATIADQEGKMPLLGSQKPGDAVGLDNK